jgi:translation initiation factor 1 (eIF-1/SUI1)
MHRKQYGNTVDWSHVISVGSSRYAHRLRESGRRPGLGHPYSSLGSKGGYFEHYSAWDQYVATPRSPVSPVWHCGCDRDPWTPVHDHIVSSQGDYRSPVSARPPVVHAPVTKQYTKGGYHSGRHASEGSATPRSPWTPAHGYDADYVSSGFGDSDDVESAHNVVVIGATVHPSIPVSARPPVVHAPVTKQYTKGGYHSGRHASEGSATPRSPWTPAHGYDADYVSSGFGDSDDVESAHNVVVIGATVHPSIPVSARPPVVHAPVTKQYTNGGYHSGKKHDGTSALGLSDLVNFNPVMDLGDDCHVPVDVLGRKIIISVVQKGPHKLTIIEGILAPLGELLKKLTKLLSCGGHVAKDKKTGSQFIQLLGGSNEFASKVGQFLIQEGICNSRDCIECRGWIWV